MLEGLDNADAIPNSGFHRFKLVVEGEEGAVGFHDHGEPMSSVSLGKDAIDGHAFTASLERVSPFSTFTGTSGRLRQCMERG